MIYGQAYIQGSDVQAWHCKCWYILAAKCDVTAYEYVLQGDKSMSKDCLLDSKTSSGLQTKNKRSLDGRHLTCHASLQR